MWQLRCQHLEGELERQQQQLLRQQQQLEEQAQLRQQQGDDMLKDAISARDAAEAAAATGLDMGLHVNTHIRRFGVEGVVLVVCNLLCCAVSCP